MKDHNFVTIGKRKYYDGFSLTMTTICTIETKLRIRVPSVLAVGTPFYLVFVKLNKDGKSFSVED